MDSCAGSRPVSHIASAQLDEKEQHIQESKFNLLMEELSLDVETWKVYQSAVMSWRVKVEHETACWKKKVWDESSHAVQSFLDKNVRCSVSYCFIASETPVNHSSAYSPQSI